MNRSKSEMQSRARLIRQARESVGLTQTEAARMARLSLRFWQNVEAGERLISDGHLELFLRKTGQWTDEAS